MSQFPEKEGGYIIIYAAKNLYILKSTGISLKKHLPEITQIENIKLIPYKEEQNNLLYIISCKINPKKFGINLYKFELISKQNFLATTKTLDMLQNKEKILSSNKEIFGSSCLFMKNNAQNEDTFISFIELGFPAEINNFYNEKDLFEEKNSLNIYQANKKKNLQSNIIYSKQEKYCYE